MSNNRKVIKVAFGSIATIATITLVSLLLTGNLDNENDSDDCFNLEDEDPITINYCHRLKCKFNVSQCTNECPFGYTLNKKYCPVSCKCGSSGLYNFDVAYSSEEIPTLLKKFGYAEESDVVSTVFSSSVVVDGVNGKKLWTKDTDGLVKVPFYFAPELFMNQERRNVWQFGVDWYAENTCVRLLEADSSCEPPCIKVLDDGGCSSPLGASLNEQQTLSMGVACWGTNTVIHETMHALGVDHMQCRPDRDEYEYVAYEVIPQDWKAQFDKMKWEHVYDLGLPYDVKSVMHYASLKVAGEEVMFDTTGAFPDGRIYSMGPTEHDINMINLVYKCNDPDAELKIATPPPPVEHTTAMMKLEEPAVSEGTGWMQWGAWSRNYHVPASTGWKMVMKKRWRACKTFKLSGQDSKCFAPRFGLEEKTGWFKEGRKEEALEQFMEWSEWYPCRPRGTRLRAKGGTGAVNVCKGTRMRFRDYVPGSMSGGFQLMNCVEEEKCQIPGCEQERIDEVLVPRYIQWSAWNPTGDCSASCAGGTREYERECRDQDGSISDECSAGETRKTAPCNEFACSSGTSTSSPETDELYGWAEWGGWLIQCVDGKQARFRVCQAKPPQTCPGLWYDTRDCISERAQADLQYTAWQEWGDCLLQKIDSCAGVKIRYRSCLSTTNECDIKGKVEMKACYRCSHGEIKWTRWRDSECSATCQGSMRRTRDCFDLSTNEASAKCVGSREETVPCNTQSCDREPKSRQPTVFAAVSSETKAMSCMDKTSRWVFGHFTGDKKVEAICTGTSGNLQLMSLIGSSVSGPLWSGKLLDCMGDDVIKYAADINGDQFDDLICKRPNSRLYHIHLKRYGEFSATPDYSTALCERDETPTFLNLNGDLRQDALCRNQRSGKTNIFINRFRD